MRNKEEAKSQTVSTRAHTTILGDLNNQRTEFLLSEKGTMYELKIRRKTPHIKPRCSKITSSVKGRGGSTNLLSREKTNTYYQLWFNIKEKVSSGNEKSWAALTEGKRGVFVCMCVVSSCFLLHPQNSTTIMLLI